MRSLWVAGCLILSMSVALAQSDRGTITGTVADVSKALIPGSTVIAKNSNTGAEYRTVSTETGNYTLAQLPAGVYELSVELPGFKKYVQQGITVLVAQTLRVDVVLEVGAVSEQVTVTADAPLLRTESGDLSHNVATERLANLPVLGIGQASAGSLGIRNPLSSVQLIPGTYFEGNSNLRVNGAPTNTYSVRIEGQEASNSGFMFSTQQTQPSVESVQEVSIQTSNYAAEYGQAGGGFVNYTMRSGTSRYHGLVYDNIVNEVFNAGLPRTQTPEGELQRDRQRRHDYGFNLSGPVYIPKIYDGRQRTFFFFNFEQFREKISVSNVNQTVPTTAYRNGDFRQALTGRQLGTDPLGRPIMEGTIYDPRTTRVAPNGFVIRDPFENNTIPQALWDPVAVKMQSLFPAPTTAALTNNFLPVWNSSRVTTIPGLKVDHTIGRLKISFYWSSTDTKGKDFPGPAEADGLPDPITKSAGSFTKSHTESLNLDYSVSPTLLWHLGVGYQHYNLNVIPRTKFNNTFPNYDVEKELGLKGATATEIFPRVQGLATGQGGMAVMGPANPGLTYTFKPSANTSLSWVKRNHTYKFGTEFRVEGYPNQLIARTSGLFNFARHQTGLPYVSQGAVILAGDGVGLPYASFLLGMVDNGDLASPVGVRLGKTIWGFYAQDSWKVTRTLTLDYGLRYDYSTYLREQYGRIPNLAPALANPSAGGYPGASIFEGSDPGRCNCDFTRNYPYAFGPRLGAAWQITPKDVLRVGWGISYTASPNSRPGATSSNLFSAQTVGEAGMLLRDGFPFTAEQVAWPRITPGLYPTVPGTISGAPTAFDGNGGGRPARIMQWSIGLQHQLFPNLVVEAAYVGNRGVWWPGEAMQNLNALTNDRLKTFGLDINNQADRTLLTSQLRSPVAQSRGFGTPPYPGFPTTQTVAQSLRPFPQFGNITSAWTPLGNTWYDALQAKVTKRFSHGLDFSTAFTWQKELNLGTEAAVNDIFDRDQNKYISSLSRPLTVSIAATYEVPRFEQNKAVSAILSNWRVGTVLLYASGLPIRVPQAQNSLNALLLRSLPAGITSLSHANRVPGEPLFLKDLNCHCIDPNKDFVLNPKAWTDPLPGQFGASPAYFNDYRYQRRPRESMSLQRDFPLTDSGVQLEVRVEFSNIFNRTTMTDPTATNASAPQQREANGNTRSGFGFISPTATPGSFRPREGLAIVKLRF